MNFENIDAENTYNSLCKQYNIRFTIYKKKHETVSKSEIIEFVDEFLKRNERS